MGKEGIKLKKILFFTHKHVSHINPILPVIRRLKREGYELYCISVLEHKEKIVNAGAEFIEYPKDFYETRYEREKMILDEKNAVDLTEKKDLTLFRYLLVKDIMSVYNYDINDNMNILDILKELKPDVIFRDAVDIVGKEIARLLNIPCVGYITNNLYSKRLFDKNPNYYYSHFLKTIEWEEGILENEYKNVYSNATQIYADVAKEFNTFQIPAYNQFDPDERYNVIFSTDFLQPKELNVNNKYIIVPPSLNSLREEVIGEEEKELIQFLNGDQKVVYVATGSFLTAPDEYYLGIIEAFKNTEYKLLISWNKNEDEIKGFLGKEYFMKNLMIRRHVPQKYVLKHSDVFISTGGFNSILESIYHQVPILVVPISAEQTLNGLLIEELGLGWTIYKRRENYITTGEMLLDLLNNDKYKKNMNLYKNKLCETNSEQMLDKVVDMLRNI